MNYFKDVCSVCGYLFVMGLNLYLMKDNNIDFNPAIIKACIKSKKEGEKQTKVYS